MSSLREIINQIRFSLDNLAAQNRHHDFEHVCRHFSRKRLGLNVIPATGPVSAGGDQGRDFETYTILPETTRAATADNGRVIAEAAAFACSIQKEDVGSKVKSDVDAIMGKGGRVEIVYFFAAANVEVAKRHELQQWAATKYKIKLEVFDGEFLAENLADKDLFWIALEYLQVPSSLYPAVDDVDYIKVKGLWENRKIEYPNFAVLDELRNLGRRALFDGNTKHDLVFWLGKLEELLTLSASAEFKRKVLYELVALRIRGTGSLLGYERLCREYFDLNSTFRSPNEAQEAQVVWTYSFGSRIRGASEFTEEELLEWRRRISDYVEAELGKQQPKTVEATLLELKGFQLLTNPLGDTVEDGLDCWFKLAALVEDVPLFPLERFSDVLTNAIAYVRDAGRYDELTSKVNGLLEKRVGGFAVAEKCRDRAVSLFEQGQPLRALREFHKVKMNWFARETLYGSLLSMLTIADIYHQLGLNYAARHYARAVAFVAHRAGGDKDKLLGALGLAALAEYEFANGEWGYFLEHAELALRALGLFAKGPGDRKTDNAFDRLLHYTALVVAFADILDAPGLGNYTKTKVATWALEELDDLVVSAKDTWSKVGDKELLGTLRAEFKSAPFRDLGARRKVSFAMSGIDWTFTWPNGLVGNAKVEQFLANLQILLAEAADTDLFLMRGKADISIDLGADYSVSNESTMGSFKWTFTFPSKIPNDITDVQKSHQRSLAIAISIVVKLSLLPAKDIESVLESLFQGGLASKVLTGHSYEVMYVDTVSTEFCDAMVRLSAPAAVGTLTFDGKTHQMFDWKDGVLDKYNETESKSAIARRYENALVPVRLTLKVLCRSPAFQQCVRNLHNAGWKDWHILMTVASVAVNYRATHIRANVANRNAVFLAEMNREETDDSIPVPIDEFNELALRQHLIFSMLSTTKAIGLEYKLGNVVGHPLQDFLSKRWRYFEDDIPHEGLFGPPPPDPS
jgi:hypothetical protein